MRVLVFYFRGTVVKARLWTYNACSFKPITYSFAGRALAISSETLNVAHAAFEEFSQGLSSGDWDAFIARLSEDFTFWFPAGPFKGRNVGKARARAFFDSVSRVFPEGLLLTVERVMNDGNTVLFEVRSHGLMFGHPYENQAAISFDIRGENVCGYREYLGAVFQVGE